MCVERAFHITLLHFIYYMLEASILEQVKGVYANLDAQYTFKMIYNKDVVCAQTMQEFLTDFCFYIG